MADRITWRCGPRWVIERMARSMRFGKDLGDDAGREAHELDLLGTGDPHELVLSEAAG